MFVVRYIHIQKSQIFGYINTPTILAFKCLWIIASGITPKTIDKVWNKQGR